MKMKNNEQIIIRVLADELNAIKYLINSIFLKLNISNQFNLVPQFVQNF